MLFLRCFFLGGCLCVVLEIFWLMTKLSPINLLKLAFCVSAVLTPLGITAALIAFGSCGFFVMVAGAGEAAFSTVTKALNGNIIPVLQLIATFCGVIFSGVAAALIREKIESN